MIDSGAVVEHNLYFVVLPTLLISFSIVHFLNALNEVAVLLSVAPD